MLRVISVWTGKAGSPWYSTLYFDGTGSVDAQAAVDQVDDLLDAIKGNQVAGVSGSIEPFVASVNPATGAVTGGYVVTPAAPHVSTAVGDMLPRAAQLQVTLKTGVYAGGREIKGKMYLPGFLSAYSDISGRVDDALRAAYVAVFDTLLSAGPDLVVWSRKNGVAYPVSAGAPNSEFAVLRSRRD